MKSPTTIKRLIEITIDYIVICIYLLLLLAVTSTFYYFVYKGITEFTEIESQFIATFTSVVPIILLFTYFDYYSNTPGRKYTKLKLHFKKKSYGKSLLRNIVKFTPWQIGHIGTIHGVYSNFDLTSIIITNIATLLLLLMLYLGLLTKDKRHLADMIAGTSVYSN
ncbi:RDD family protein [Macrococcus sp. EM39E]|uniref:RDD family protein n=1 Tax=Macrococcus animalis TaxID=3395467 RepID=UPI0039BEAD72